MASRRPSPMMVSHSSLSVALSLRSLGGLDAAKGTASYCGLFHKPIEEIPVLDIHLQRSRKDHCMVVLGLFEADSQGDQVSSPRTVAFLNTSSTIIASSQSTTSSSRQSPSRGVMTNVTVMNDGNEVSVVIADKVGSPGSSKDAADSNLAVNADQVKSKATSPTKRTEQKVNEVEASSPQSQDPTEAFVDYPQLMPQAGSNAGYYLGYNPADPPPSPSPAGLGTVRYDAASFFQQPGAFAPLSRVAGGAAASPLSPPRPVASTMGAVPPASPLFPRPTSGGRISSNNTERTPVSIAAPPSPNLGYISPGLGAYRPPYPVVPTGSSHSSDSPDVTWGERYVASHYCHRYSARCT
jgi:hypothetical protein